MDPRIGILLAFPIFFLTMALEYWSGKSKGKKLYYFPDFITNLALGVGNQAVNVVSKILILLTYDYFYQRFALFDLGQGIVTIVVLLVVFDFIYYWAHRWSHEVNFLWGAHVVHHQSEEYNLSVALRQPWFHHLIAFPLFLPLAFLGFSTVLLGGVGVFITLYQYWVHTKEIGKMHPWIEYVFNTPSHHRVHHAVDPKYIDKNHAAFLIIWDRIFGTYKEEEEEPTYGITKPFASWNPVWSNIHYYVEMIQAAAKMKSWKDRLSIPFRRPGWLPEELGGYQAPQPVDKQNYQKFRTETSRSIQIYVFTQLMLVIAGLSLYIYHYDTLTPIYKFLGFSLIILTCLICGALMERKPWVQVAEFSRLALAFIVLNSMYYQQFSQWFYIMLIGSLAGLVLFSVWNFRNQKDFNYTVN